jgi:hypothetical protein
MIGNNMKVAGMNLIKTITIKRMSLKKKKINK